MKKLVSLLLSAVMVASMVPFAVTANAAESDVKPVSVEPVAEETPTEQPTTAPETTQPVTEAPVKAPAAPANFKVKETASDYIIIRWDKVADATSYIVYRADENSSGKMGSYSVIKNIDDTEVTAYKNSANIKAGKVYKYKIVAVKTVGDTTKTSPEKVITTMTKPQNVSSLKVTKRSTSAIVIKWSKSSAASNYVVQRSTEDAKGKFSAYKTITTTKSTTTSIKNTGLKAGYIYKYKVKVKRTKSSVSNESTGKTVTAVVTPATPKKLINKKSTTTKIKIAWSKVAKATKYEVYRKAAKTKYTKLTTTASRSYVDSKIVTGKNYKYKVRAYRTVKGKKYYGGFKALKTSSAVNGVKGITVKTYLSRGLFSWNAISGASGYEIAVKRANGSWLVKANTSYRNYLTGKLKTNKTYTYRIRSYKTVNGSKVYGKGKTFNVTASNTAYGKTVSGTWVEVCTETQQMFMYVNNKLYVKTPVITGYYYDSGRRTTPGFHRVLSKKAPATLHGSYGGSSWNVTVSHWLGFTGDGQGIHSATWQSNFGGELYKLSSRGSHGCVNTPTGAISKMYSKAYVGMPVVVY
ncbi:MAG: L,D-transpeptidase family protein [Ruminococcus sp.]|nr:L,D-transpeptidase family protein [Ruminococcus sp.]